MVSVAVEMNQMGVRFTLDASDLNADGIKQAVERTFRRVQDTLIETLDVHNTRVLNPNGIKVYLDPETRRVECNIPYIEVRVQLEQVPRVSLRTH